MENTNKVPIVPLSKFKRTKMIATIGPATNDYDSILAMMKGGVNGFRMNFSHGDYDERVEQIKWVRKASKEYGKPVAIIQDLQGPKMRLGDFEGMINIERGQEYALEYKADFEHTGHIPTQIDLSKRVKRGLEVKVNDGKVKFHITSVRAGKIYLKAHNSGILTKRKGINVPDIDFAGGILTAKDRKDVVWGANQDIDYVALSFVQKASDVAKLRTFLKGHGSKAKIIAKIETKAGVENLDEIIQASDSVMVARGDLAIETSVEAIPILTRQIIGKCLEFGKISIIATQKLASMTDAPTPTRAEVSDVATSVIVGADAVMLSEETASGNYPLEAVEVMKNIIIYTQENSPLKPLFFKEDDTSFQSAISSATITLAHQVQAKAIVAETKHGVTAISISAHRPNMPIIMVTNNRRTAHQLAIVYGSKVFVRPESAKATTQLTQWLRNEHTFKKGDIIVTASGKQTNFESGTDTIKVRKLE